MKIVVVIRHIANLVLLMEVIVCYHLYLQIAIFYEFSEDGVCGPEINSFIISS